MFWAAVGVKIKGGSGRTVSQECTDGFHVCALFQQFGGKGMAQRVEVDIFQIQFLSQAFETALDGAGFGCYGAAEHIGRAIFQRFQQIQNIVGHRNDSPGPRRLRRSDGQLCF